MDASDGAEPPKQASLDAERARLRAQGYTDHEISQIFIAKAAAPSPATGGGGGGRLRLKPDRPT